VGRFVCSGFSFWWARWPFWRWSGFHGPVRPGRARPPLAQIYFDCSDCHDGLLALWMTVMVLLVGPAMRGL